MMPRIYVRATNFTDVLTKLNKKYENVKFLRIEVKGDLIE